MTLSGTTPPSSPPSSPRNPLDSSRFTLSSSSFSSSFESNSSEESAMPLCHRSVQSPLEISERQDSIRFIPSSSIASIISTLVISNFSDHKHISCFLLLNKKIQWLAYASPANPIPLPLKKFYFELLSLRQSNDGVISNPRPEITNLPLLVNQVTSSILRVNLTGINQTLAILLLLQSHKVLSQEQSSCIMRALDVPSFGKFDFSIPPLAAFPVGQWTIFHDTDILIIDNSCNDVFRLFKLKESQIIDKIIIKIHPDNSFSILIKIRRTASIHIDPLVSQERPPCFRYKKEYLLNPLLYKTIVKIETASRNHISKKALRDYLHSDLKLILGITLFKKICSRLDSLAPSSTS